MARGRRQRREARLIANINFEKFSKFFRDLPSRIMVPRCPRAALSFGETRSRETKTGYRVGPKFSAGVDGRRRKRCRDGADGACVRSCMAIGRRGMPKTGQYGNQQVSTCCFQAATGLFSVPDAGSASLAPRSGLCRSGYVDGRWVWRGYRQVDHSGAGYDEVRRPALSQRLGASDGRLWVVPVPL